MTTTHSIPHSTNGNLRKSVSYVHPLSTDRVSITTLQTATYNDSTRESVIRPARGKSKGRCPSNASRTSRYSLACLTGTTRPSPHRGFCPRLATSPSNRTTVLADPVAFEKPLLDTSVSIVLDERGALAANQFRITDKDTMSACVGHSMSAQRKSITRHVDVKYTRFEKESQRSDGMISLKERPKGLKERWMTERRNAAPGPGLYWAKL